MQFYLDTHPCAEPFSYTTLIQVKDILDKNWRIFSEHLPKKLASNKQELMLRLVELNRIRNNVMHPVRGNAPSEDDFSFVRELVIFLQLDQWAKPG